MEGFKIVKNLKKLRLEKGLSQKKLAEIMSVSQQSINKYENHSIEPDIETLILMADYFNTSVDYLIGYSEIRHKIERVEPFHLNEDESDMLKKYRKLTSKMKKSIHLVLDNYLD